MAAADYYLCDICECKTFYDAELYQDKPENYAPNGHPWPDGNIGGMAVICTECAKEWEIKFKKKEVRCFPKL